MAVERASGERLSAQLPHIDAFDNIRPMNAVSVAFAKLAGFRKAVESALDDEHKRAGNRPIQNFSVEQVGRYFEGAAAQLAVLRKELPELFGDFANIDTIPKVEMTSEAEKWRYGRAQLEQLGRDVDQMLEVRANSELSAPASDAEKRRVFISHGSASDWREVQAFVEKDIGLPTIELAQEPNLGRTVLVKLDQVSDSCDSAVIVMTGDDLDAEGQARARQNVLHEIGFFQAKYGLSRICLLHEEGVSIPSNIHGLVYIPFPKGTVGATFGVLFRELKAFYKLK